MNKTEEANKLGSAIWFNSISNINGYLVPNTV